MQKQNNEKSSTLQNIVDAVTALDLVEPQPDPETKLYYGRFPIMPITLLMLLFTTLAFASAIIHFSQHNMHFLFPQAIVQVILFIQIFLYHLSFRARRITLTFLHLLFTILFVAFLDFILLDQISQIPHHISTFFLKFALITYSLVPIVNFLHFAYLGRSYRTTLRW